MAPSEILVFDLETTGLDPSTDEILQVSFIDGNGQILLNSYVHPSHHNSWPAAESINGITPEMVSDSPTIDDLRQQIQNIFNNAKRLVAYNGTFDMRFLVAAGITIPNKADYFDVMLKFAPIYGEWNERIGDYRWQKLTTCAQYYGYNFTAHDSLEDVKATLYCYKKMRAPLGTP